MEAMGGRLWWHDQSLVRVMSEPLNLEITGRPPLLGLGRAPCSLSHLWAITTTCPAKDLIKLMWCGKPLYGVQYVVPTNQRPATRRSLHASNDTTFPSLQFRVAETVTYYYTVCPCSDRHEVT